MTVDRPGDATALLLAWRAGDDTALAALMPLVHRELHTIAERLMSRERPGQTLQPTALVNEAFIRLLDANQIKWQSRAHFLAMAARVMRRVLVDAARTKHAAKRGAGAEKILLEDSAIGGAEPGRDVIALHDALEALAAIDPRKSRVVELRYFGGLTVEETAEVLGVSQETVHRDWKMARVWLVRELGGGPPAER